MIVLAIDAGNGFFKVAVPDATGNPQLLYNKWGEPSTASVVFFGTDGSIITGTEAKHAALADPTRAVSSWKRSMGTDNVLHRTDDGEEYRAEDILYILLKEVKENAEAKTGQGIAEAVICVPANYTDPQKQSTINAVNRAGMDVLRLIPEPTSAALGNKVQDLGDCISLVYDLGDGTFDVSIVKSNGNVTEILSTGGESHLGSRDFGDAIKQKALERFESEYGFRPTPDEHPLFFQDLSDRVERVKISLSVKEQTNLVVSCDGHVLNMPVGAHEFETWTADLIKKTIECTKRTIQDAKLTPDKINVIFAVGGGSRMRWVSEELEKALGRKPTEHCEAIYAGAYGGVLAGRIEYARRGKSYMIEDYALPSPDVHLRDVTSHPIGVCVLSGNRDLVCQEILPKNTLIPSVQTKTFRLGVSDQTEALIEILQGENAASRKDCALLGHFTLTELPQKKELTERIEICLNLDINAMLVATARDKESSRTADLQIAYKHNEKEDDSDDASAKKVEFELEEIVEERAEDTVLQPV
jgi:molecular chaperone DnaK